MLLIHTSSLIKTPAQTRIQMCEAIDNLSAVNETFTKLYAAANIFYNYTGTATCFFLDNTTAPLGGWDWQVPNILI